MMSPSGLGRCWRLWLLAWLAAVAMPRHAGAIELVIRLADSSQHAPSHLCVAAGKIAGLTEAEKAHQGGDPKVPRKPLSLGISIRDPNLTGPTSGALSTRLLDCGITPFGSACPQQPAPVLDACGVWKAGSVSDTSALSNGTCPVPPRAACEDVRVDPGQLSDDQLLSCRTNAQPSSARGRLGVVVLNFQRARIQSFSLTGDLARVQLDPVAAESNDLPMVQVVGGTYAKSSAVPLRELTGTGLVEVPLLSRCSEQRLLMPSYECPHPLLGDADVVVLKTGTHYAEVSRAALTTAAALDVPNEASTVQELVMLACPDRARNEFTHELRATWRTSDSPEDRNLVPTRVQFSWERDGLVGDDDCPDTAELVERGVKCNVIRAAAADCAYTCSGAIPLPTVVQLSRARTPSYPPEQRSPPAQVWELLLARPGQKLHGFVPGSEAEVSLHWCGWRDSSNQDRSTQWGEEIPSVLLVSGDGRSFRVAPNTTRLRVANVRRNDAFSVAFQGRRVYKSDIARVGPGGVLTIWHPAASRKTPSPECSDIHPGVQSDLRADKVVFALSLAGGLRTVNGQTRTRWSPYGELDVISTIRAFRVHAGDLYFEPELRAGVALTSVPYGRAFEASSLEDDLRQTGVTTALFPIELMFHFFDNQPLHFSVGGGGVFARPLFSSDSERVSNVPRGSLAATLGIGVSSDFAIDAEFRLISGNERVEKTFDEGGLSRQVVDGFDMLMFGVRLRLNDAFEGGQARSYAPPEEVQSPMKPDVSSVAPSTSAAVGVAP